MYFTCLVFIDFLTLNTLIDFLLGNILYFVKFHFKKNNSKYAYIKSHARPALKLVIAMKVTVVKNEKKNVEPF